MLHVYHYIFLSLSLSLSLEAISYGSKALWYWCQIAIGVPIYSCLLLSNVWCAISRAETGIQVLTQQIPILRTDVGTTLIILAP